jgi:uncharacterized peroxidase-related enzyme
MTAGFLEEPPMSAAAQALFDEDLAETGYVSNGSRLWAYQPETQSRLFDLMSQAFRPSALQFRQRGMLVTACASTFGDAYCSLAWGGKLAKASDPGVAAGVLSGTDEGLTDQERAIVSWARKVAKDPNATTARDVQQLRDAGLTDEQIFAITAFVALRLALAIVNDALGSSPDAKLVEALPPEVAESVTWGRPVETAVP